MQISIKTSGFPLTNSLRSYAERRLRFALTRYCDRIRHVIMRLSDDNSLRGRLNKRCHLQVVIAGPPDVVVEADEADFRKAINRATDRIGHNVALRLHSSISCSTSDARPYRIHGSRSA